MNDIDNSSSSKMENSSIIDLRRSQKIICTLMSFFSAALYSVPHKALPQLEETLSSLDIELPMITLFLFDAHPVFSLLSLLSFLPLLVWLGAVFQYRVLRFLNNFSKANMVISSIVFSIFLWGTYSPAFNVA